MAKNFVSIDRDTPLLLPPDLREWVPANDPVHFVLEVTQQLPTSTFSVNPRGSGSAQYPPSMLLALLVYCYSRGIFSSRRIEEATYRDIGVRYLTGDTHPDHDTICAFRRANAAALQACFAHLITFAKELGLLKVGIVSVDGTLLKASAAKDKNITHGRAILLSERLAQSVRELLEKAEQADQTEQSDRLPEHLASHEKLREQVREAKERIEARHREHVEEMNKTPVKERRGSNDKRHPKDTPPPDARDNFTDPDSRLMRKSKSSGFIQGYNAQAVVDAEGSQLILATRISQSASDARELVADLDAIPANAGVPHTILADSGYHSEPELETLLARGLDLYIGVSAPKPSPYGLAPETLAKPLSKKALSPQGQAMRDKLNTPEGKARYKLRKQSVEPVFGTIKKALGFTQFHLRGRAGVELEWLLIALAYNVKRLWNLTTRQTRLNPAPA